MALQCSEPNGASVGDGRGPAKTTEWAKIAYQDQDKGGAVELGYVSVANLGQLTTAGSGLKLCD